MSIKEELKIQIEKLTPKENDVIIIKGKGSLTDEDAARIVDAFKKLYKDTSIKAFICDESLDFNILTDKQLKELGLKRI